MPKKLIQDTPPSLIRELYQMMYDLHRIMMLHHVKYWAEGGTLLGAIRNKGIIPWDEDIDIGITTKDVPKLLEMKNSLHKCGYSICKVWFGYKIFYTKKPHLIVNDKELCFSYPFVDVYTYRRFPDGYYRLSIKKAREMRPQRVWNDENLFPPCLYDFGSYFILGARNPGTYLSDNFGFDWETTVTIYDPKTNQDVSMDITPSLKKAAIPSGPIRRRRCID